MKKILLFVFITLSVLSCEDKQKGTIVEIDTDFGKIKCLLFDSTPKHRDNFIKLAKEGFYDGTLFHRVIKGFMVQGGDPDSKNAAPGATLGSGNPGYMLDAEIGAPHFRGALAAARTPNPQKRSSGSQFYIVQGKPVTDDYLKNIEKQKGITYTPEQKEFYKTQGGTPFLDGDYTVFGKVLEGMDVIDKITEVQVDASDRPIEDIKMTIKVVE